MTFTLSQEQYKMYFEESSEEKRSLFALQIGDRSFHTERERQKGTEPKFVMTRSSHRG